MLAVCGEAIWSQFLAEAASLECGLALVVPMMMIIIIMMMMMMIMMMIRLMLERIMMMEISCDDT